nr:zinc finger, CCHC-type [Tanacetum cinerariifolium]
MAAVAMKHIASNFAKLDKIEGVNFRRWQNKMHFLLSSMSVVYVLTTPISDDGGDDPTVEQVRKSASGTMMTMYNNNKGKRKHHDNIRTDPNKKEKPTCWKCSKTCHIKRNCKGVNVGNKANGSGTKGSGDGSSNTKRMMMLHGGLTQEKQFMCVKIDVGSRPYESLNDGFILHIRNELIALSITYGGDLKQIGRPKCFGQKAVNIPPRRVKSGYVGQQIGPFFVFWCFDFLDFRCLFVFLGDGKNEEDKGGRMNKVKEAVI